VDFEFELTKIITSEDLKKEGPKAGPGKNGLIVPGYVTKEEMIYNTIGSLAFLAAFDEQ
jgi:hypothetical protein